MVAKPGPPEVGLPCVDGVQGPVLAEVVEQRTLGLVVNKARAGGHGGGRGKVFEQRPQRVRFRGRAGLYKPDAGQAVVQGVAKVGDPQGRRTGRG
ncbi:MAG: hypothetical protein KIT54_07065 [Phycisphaeraceae bacterium]|nr:hypothetical protein [Phycisphaeraceae bacterium]